MVWFLSVQGFSPLVIIFEAPWLHRYSLDSMPFPISRCLTVKVVWVKHTAPRARKTPQLGADYSSKPNALKKKRTLPCDNPSDL